MAERKGNNIFVWIIFGLLAVGLMGFGSKQFSSSGQEIGSVGTRSITSQDYGNALSAGLRQMQQQTGQRVTLADAQAAGLDQQVMAQLVQRNVIASETDRLGLSVGDTIVLEQLRNIPSFQLPNGTFDPEGYRSVLQRRNMREEDFENNIRTDITSQLYQSAMVDGISAPKTFADVLAGYILETRNVSWVPVVELAEPVGAPSDEEMQAFYDENIARYTAPERRTIDYAVLTPEMLQDEVEVDEALLRQAYDDRINDYVQPERRLVERLIFPTSEAAEAAAARLAEGGTFEAEVETRGLDLATIDLGDVSQKDLGSAGEAVFAVEPGEVVGPLDTDLGPALFRMNAILDGLNVPFEDAKGELREGLAAEAARRLINSEVPAIQDFIAGAATPADLAEKTPMERGTLVWSQEAGDGIAAYAEVRAAAPNLTKGATLAELVELEDGGVVAMVLNDVTPSQPMPFDEVRGQVAEAWTLAEEAKRRAAEAEAMKARLEEGATFAGLGLEPTVIEALSRNQVSAPGTPAGFVNAVYETDEGRYSVVTGPEGTALFRVDTVNDADLSNEDGAALRRNLEVTNNRQVAEEVYQIISEQLQVDTDVNLNPAAINAINARLQ